MKTKHMLKLSLVVVGVMVLAQAVPAGADTVTLGVDRAVNPNSNGTAVTAVLRCGTENYGTASQVLQRSLVAFDLSQLVDGSNNPVYSEITSLTINLEQRIATWATQNPPEGYPLTAYAISQSSGGWDPNDNAASLFNASYETPAAGVYTYTDYVAAGATVSITLSGDLTGLVNSWLSGENAGFMIQGMENSPYVVRKFEPDTPELVVEYTAIPEPVTMAMLGLGGVMMLVRGRRRK